MSKSVRIKQYPYVDQNESETNLMVHVAEVCNKEIGVVLPEGSGSFWPDESHRYDYSNGLSGFAEYHKDRRYPEQYLRRPNDRKHRFPDCRTLSLPELTDILKDTRDRGSSELFSHIFEVIAPGVLHIDDKIVHKNLNCVYVDTLDDSCWYGISFGKYLRRDGDGLCVVEDEEATLCITQSDAWCREQFELTGEVSEKTYDVSRLFKKDPTKSKFSLREIDRACPDLTEDFFGCEYEEIPEVLKHNSLFRLPEDGQHHDIFGLGFSVSSLVSLFTSQRKGMIIDSSQLRIKGITYVPAAHSNPILVIDNPKEIIAEV